MQEVIKNTKLPSNVLLNNNLILPYFIPYTAAAVSQIEAMDMLIIAISFLKKTIINNETRTSKVALIGPFFSYGRIVLLIRCKIGRFISFLKYILYISIVNTNIDKRVINTNIEFGHNK
tara:strand:+ start:152 stop:508 length:357 start_codon:yes stop_codon:yes gene_type:complete